MGNKLSHSSVQMFQECSVKYKLHYIDKIRTDNSKSAFLFGNALDMAFNSLLKGDSLSKALNIYEYRMKNTIINNKRVRVLDSKLITYTKNDFNKELVSHFNGKQHINQPWYSLFLKGKLIVEAYHYKVIPKIQKVISIQKRISLKNEDGDSISGLMDAIVIWEDGKTYLIDNKSSTVKYEDDSVRQSNQLALYHYIEKDNVHLDGAGFIVLDKNIEMNSVKTCGKCSYISTSSHRKCEALINQVRCNGEWVITYNPTVNINYFFDKIQEEDENRVIEEFDRVNKQIHKQEFSCDFDKCYTKFGRCPYYYLCRDGSMVGLVNLKEKK